MIAMSNIAHSNLLLASGLIQIPEISLMPALSEAKVIDQYIALAPNVAALHRPGNDSISEFPRPGPFELSRIVTSESREGFGIHYYRGVYRKIISEIARGHDNLAYYGRFISMDYQRTFAQDLEDLAGIIYSLACAINGLKDIALTLSLSAEQQEMVIQQEIQAEQPLEVLSQFLRVRVGLATVVSGSELGFAWFLDQLTIINS